jgi:hypothetical protein
MAWGQHFHNFQHFLQQSTQKGQTMEIEALERSRMKIKNQQRLLT